MWMSVNILLFVNISLVLGTDCRNGWLAYSGSCYLFGSNAMHFTESENYCRQHNSHLVHVNSAAENAFLKDYMRKLTAHNWWLGLTDEETEGIFKWFDTDTVAEFTDWNPGQPDPYDEDCVVFWIGFDFRWGDYGCTKTDALPLCEMNSDNVDVIG